jgi:hypothetical protein
VVRHTSVEDPASGPQGLSPLITKVEDLFLDEMDARLWIDSGGWWRSGLGIGCVHRVYVRFYADVHQGPVLFLLHLGHVGHHLLFLATTILGLVARFSAVVAAVSTRWSAAIGVLGAHVLAITSIALPGS